jgi:hypothetical protein
MDLPSGLKLDLALETSLSADKSAVGDPVTAVLKKPLKIGNEVVAPKGAMVHGRITALRQQNKARPSYVVGLEFFELETPEIKARLRAKLELMAAAPGFLTTLENSPVSGRYAEVLKSELKGTAIENVFFVRGNNFHLTRGLRMVWRTEPFGDEDKQ